ncbi:MAG: hypothetical protein R2867_37080 [Caldilineaceae bacterium]
MPDAPTLFQPLQAGRGRRERGPIDLGSQARFKGIVDAAARSS